MLAEAVVAYEEVVVPPADLAMPDPLAAPARAVVVGEASSSSGAAVVAPPPLPPSLDAPPAVKRQRQVAENTMVFGSGMITYYSSNRKFQATCLEHFLRCTLTKKGWGPKGKAKPGQRQGRPLGLLAHWLTNPQGAGDKAARVDKKIVADLAGPGGKAARQAARELLKTAPMVAGLMGEEDQKDEGYDSEPDAVFMRRQ